MNYLLFLTAFLSFVSAAYTIKEDTKYMFRYKAHLVQKTGNKTCTGFGKVEIEINGKTYYGENLYPGKQLTNYGFEWISPKGVTTATVTRKYKYSTDGSNNFEYSSDNCQVIYKDQDFEAEFEPCEILKDNPNEKGLEAALERRVSACLKACGSFGAVTGLISAVTLPPLIAVAGVAASGCALNCRDKACKKGLVGKECVKLGSSCNPNGLRCCKAWNGDDRQCQKNRFGNYKCRN